MSTPAGRAVYIFPGYDEALFLLDAPSLSPEEAASRLAALGNARIVAIKMGAAGAFMLVDGAGYSQRAYPVQAVDPVGAGDAFVGAFLAAMLQGHSPREALDVACAAGALVVTTEGDYEALPEWPDVQALCTGQGMVTR